MKHGIFAQTPAKAGWVAWALMLAACNPTFNWREVKLEGTPLVALLPCKPDKATRTVPLGGEPVAMSMAGCEAGGVNFTVAAVPVADAAKAAGLLKAWRGATQGNFAVARPELRPFTPKGAQAGAESVLLAARGKQADGSAVAVQAAWFVRGAHIYQALAYGERLSSDAAETFFSSIALQ